MARNVYNLREKARLSEKKMSGVVDGGNSCGLLALFLSPRYRCCLSIKTPILLTSISFSSSFSFLNSLLDQVFLHHLLLRFLLLYFCFVFTCSSFPVSSTALNFLSFLLLLFRCALFFYSCQSPPFSRFLLFSPPPSLFPFSFCCNFVFCCPFQSFTSYSLFSFQFSFFFFIIFPFFVFLFFLSFIIIHFSFFFTLFFLFSFLSVCSPSSFSTLKKKFNVEIRLFYY